MAYELVNSNHVFSGRILDVIQDTIKLPNGKDAVREVVRHVNASAVVPVNENGEIIFVRQYRHPAGEEILEIPAGTFNGDEENPVDCAARELEEETGYKTGKLTLLSSSYSSIGFCTEIIHIYAAENLTAGTQNLDPDEFVSIETYSLDEAVEMIFNGKIKDSKTIIGLLTYKEQLRKE